MYLLSQFCQVQSSSHIPTCSIDNNASMFAQLDAESMPMWLHSKLRSRRTRPLRPATVVALAVSPTRAGAETSGHGRRLPVTQGPMTLYPDASGDLCIHHCARGLSPSRPDAEIPWPRPKRWDSSRAARRGVASRMIYARDTVGGTRNHETDTSRLIERIPL